MTVKFLEIPVEEYGVVKVAIEPIEPNHLSKDLGVREIPPSEAEYEELARPPREMVEAGIAVATSAFDRVSATVSTLAQGLQHSLQEVTFDEAAAEFGLAIKGDAGVVLAQAGVEAAVKVTLTWKKAPSRPEEKNGSSTG